MRRVDTWMPLYWGDYARDTGHLNAAGHGAYLMLIKHYWCTGRPLVDDDNELWRIACCDSRREWLKLRPKLERLFIADGNCLRHKRIDAELEKTSALTLAKQKAGKDGAQKRWAARDQPIENKGNSDSRAIDLLSSKNAPSQVQREERKEEEYSLRESGPAGRGTAPATNAQLDILEPDKVVTLRQPSAASEATEAIAAYNVVAAQRGLSQASPRQSPARLASLRLRLRDLGGMEGWHVAMDRLAEADFIKYDWSGFSFGLMLRAETMNRLMEGTYRQRKRSKDGYHSAADVRASGERVKARYAELMKTMEG